MFRMKGYSAMIHSPSTPGLIACMAAKESRRPPGPRLLPHAARVPPRARSTSSERRVRGRIGPMVPSPKLIPTRFAAGRGSVARSA